MTMKRRSFASNVLGRWMLLVLFACAAPTSIAEGEPDAKALLMEMAEFMSGMKNFSVDMRNGYDAPQDSGQMIEWNEKRKATISRPDRFRVEVEHSDGEKHLVLFDGETITVSSTPQNVYAQSARPGTIDDALRYFLRDLGMRLPLAAMMVNAFPAEMERRVTAVDYVEKTNILDSPAHHLAARTQTVDFQVWISATDKPLPLRIVLTYKNLPGAPQFWAVFSRWNLAPEVTEATFAFSAPEDGRKISFINEVTPLAMQANETSTKKGEQK